MSRQLHANASSALQNARSRVDPARWPSVLKIAENCPPKYRGTYLRAAAGLVSAKVAVKAMCQHCLGWSGLDQPCTAYGCPLWAIQYGRKPARARKVKAPSADRKPVRPADDQSEPVARPAAGQEER